MKRSGLFIAAAATLLALTAGWLAFRPKSPLLPEAGRVDTPAPSARPRPEPATAYATPEDRFANLMKTKGSAAALAVAKALTGKEREDAVFFLLSYGSIKDPEFVARELADCGLSPVHCKMVTDILMSQWHDPERAYEWAQRELTGEVRKSAISTALGRIAQVSPQRAIGEIGKLSDKGERDQAYGTVLLYWADTDFPAALEYLRNLSDTGDRSSLSITLASRWAEKDPASAKAELATDTTAQCSIQLAHHLALNEAKTDPKGALEWASGVSGEAGERAVRSALMAWAESDSATAAAYVDGADESARKRLEPALAGLWANQDPAAAAAWVLQHADPEAQAAMAVEVVHRWVDQSPDAASAWVDALPAGVTKDRTRTLLDQRLAAPADQRFRIHPDLYRQSSEDSMFPVKPTADW